MVRTVLPGALRLPTAGPPLSAPAPDAPINPLHEDYFAEKTSVTAMLEELRDMVPLTAEGAAGRFAVQEWTPGGKSRDGVETS
ncbi:hypothetical protein GCM10009549_49100 [Streptomyces thermoalcalitolerans]|uniref:Uncharacterized protein n=1 Tax=Streptomyces thermoalcalitolerans TaxID=65605 RepID=A0ABP3ZU34_9ACTN